MIRSNISEEMSRPPAPPGANYGMPDFTPVLHEAKGTAYLTQNHFPAGVAAAMVKTPEKIAFRYFICDDSGSM